MLPEGGFKWMRSGTKVDEVGFKRMASGPNSGYSGDFRDIAGYSGMNIFSCMNQLPLPTRKPRNDSVLKQLPAHKQKEIADFARTHSLMNTCEWLATQGINTSKSSLGEFLSWFRPFEQNEAGVLAVMAHLQAKHPDWSPEQIREMGSSYFAAYAVENTDFKIWHQMQTLDLRREEMELNHAQFEHIQEKHAFRREQILHRLRVLKEKSATEDQP
jgi:hypothetical protein